TRREFPVVVGASLAVWALAFFAGSQISGGGRVLPQWVGFVLLAAFAVYEFWTVYAAKKGSDPAPTESADVAAPEKSSAWRIFFALAQIVVGLALLVFGSKLFVGGAVSIARAMNVSELVIGLTLVAIGTSLPELTVSIIATLRGETGVAFGNVAGSNVCNLLLVLGGTVALLPGGLAVQRQSLVVDMPIMIAAAALAWYFCATDRKLERWEGAALVAAQFAYAGYLVCAA
ncbi:MAG: sodium:calcium antiporter, partial [Thermoguttaceae bacterium]|nr:sodium:calcium antiporter [Thermoguttaceae bacterium]